MPAEKPSTITSESWAKAASSAGPSSASDQTLAMPTEEPRRAGLTKTGVPSDRQLAQHGLRLGVPAREPHARVGDLRHVGGGQDLFEDDLVHAQRRGEHARADVGHVEQLQQALQRPVLAERAVQDTGKTTSAPSSPPPGRSDSSAPSKQPRRRRARSSPAAPRGRPRPRPRAPTRPSSARPRARTSARPPGPRPSWRRRGVGDGVGESASRRRRSPSRGRSSPSRRVERGVPAAGDWSLTRPTFAGSGRVRTCTLKPASSSVAVASSSVGWSVVTSGTSGRALATVSLTVAPLSTRVPAGGSCSITVPGGCVVSCSVTSAVSPSLLELRPRRRRRCSPTSFGTSTPDAPLETVTVTVRPLVSDVPPSGEVEITSPVGHRVRERGLGLGLEAGVAERLRPRRPRTCPRPRARAPRPCRRR